MTTEKIYEELKALQGKLDEIIDEAASNGATREEVEDLIEAMIKIKRAKLKFKK